MPPSIDKEINKRIKSYDSKLFIEWDLELERFALKRKGEDGQIYHILYVQNKDGSFRPLDNRIMDEIYECDIWRHFKDAKNYWEFIQEKNRTNKLKAENLRREFLQWYNKEHKADWKKAIDNAQRGIF